MQATRFETNPIITPNMDRRMGTNVNGPSLIRVPEWVEEPLGQYYLYFAHHRGTYIRLAYADRLDGPWEIYSPGALDLDESRFLQETDSYPPAHVASPDVHVDEGERRIRMYYHGMTEAGQKTRVALSDDGIDFDAREPIVGDWYFRVFDWNGTHYALSRGGTAFRSSDPLAQFERGPTLFSDLRHCAAQVVGDTLRVFYTNIGDRPERLLVSRIDLTQDWVDWEPSETEDLLKPECEYEGGDRPLKASERGPAHERVRELRDPAIYVEDGTTYLLYSIAGERGIAIAELNA